MFLSGIWCPCVVFLACFCGCFLFLSGCLVSLWSSCVSLRLLCVSTAAMFLFMVVLCLFVVVFGLLWSFVSLCGQKIKNNKGGMPDEPPFCIELFQDSDKEGRAHKRLENNLLNKVISKTNP